MDEKPLISYCLFCFNQEAYIAKAVRGALQQSYSPLEIIVSDDCSTDNTWAIILDTVKNYTGIHKIVLNKNNRNLGIGGNFSKVCYELSGGEYIITSAGDDISKNDHVEKAVAFIKKYDNVGMVDFSADIIDKDDNVLRRIAHRQDVQKITLSDLMSGNDFHFFAPGRIIKTSWVKIFPPIEPSCPVENSVMIYRSLFTSGFYLINEPLIFYRRHDNNLSLQQNLMKISLSAIIDQLTADLMHLYKMGYIDEKTTKLIKVRLGFECILLRLRHGYLSTILHKKIQYFCVRCVQYVYKLYRFFLVIPSKYMVKERSSRRLT